MYLNAPAEVRVSNYLRVGQNLNVIGNSQFTGYLVVNGGVQGNVTGNLTGAVTGNASTATALAANPTDCGTGAFAQSIVASGNLTCSVDGSALTGLTGANVSGTVANATNAVSATSATTAATVTGAAQSAITSVGTLTSLTVAGTPVGNTGLVNSTAALTGTGSVFQAAIKGRADVAAGFGSSTFLTPAVAWGVRGEVDGSNLTGTYNYVAGVTGKYSITGTNASTFPKVGVLGIIDNGTTTGDAAVMAELDGDSSPTTTARAGYGIMTINSTSANGFSYGMDLQLQTIPGHEDFSRAFKVADIRLSSGTTIGSGATNPTTCVKGSIYLNTTSGLLNVCEAADTWTAK